MQDNLEKKRGFGSRWGLIVTLLGLAVGTGNIWRFPRQLALNGGGAFIVAWTVMLLAVAIPLAIAEMYIGRSTRHGVPGAFRDILGKKFTWMGNFMTITVVCIASYYTVVMAWVLRYLILSITQELYAYSDKAALFDQMASGSWLTVVCFVICAVLTAAICAGGVSASIEKVQKACVPLLFVLLVIMAVRAVTLPGAIKGVEFMFDVKPEYLFNSTTWINALVQILWSVGVGWGLVISYGVYTQSKSDVALNGFIQGFGNNVASLLAGLVVLPTLFAYYSVEQATEICASGNNGLTFISLTNIFGEMPGGRIIAILFFATLFLAALSSNIGHFLVGSIPFVDAGWSKRKSNLLVFVIVLIWGLPSALSIHFRDNQDFVSGIALVIGILFTCFLINKEGVDKVRETFINIPENELHCGKWWTWQLKFIAPGLSLFMVLWCIKGYLGKENMWSIFEVESFATLMVQLAIYLVVAVALSGLANKYTKHKYYNGKSYPEIPKEHE